MARVSDLYSVHDGYVVVDVHVQPRAGKTAVVGRHGAALKLRVAAPPADGRANTATCALLAETFGVKARAVSIVSGDSSRTKRVRVDGVEGPDAETVLRRALERAAEGPGGRESPRGSRG
jgi:uncharacterized protein (TIGR00251 family)